MDWRVRDLHYFRTVARSGSISAAAVQLHLAQPPLSRAIRQLETRLGVRLLERHPRGIRLTPAGQQLLQTADRVIGELEDAERQLSALAAGRAGRLRIAAIPALIWDFLPPALAEFGHRYPEVNLTLSALPPSGTIDAVRENRADLAVLAGRHAGSLPPALSRELQLRPVARLPLRLAVPLRLAHLPDPVSLAELVAETWILPWPSLTLPGLHEIVLEMLARFGVVPRERREVSSMQVGIPLIAAGLGIGLVPLTRHNLQERAIALRDLAPSAPTWDIIAVQRRPADPGTAVSNLVRLLDPGAGREFTAP